MQYTRATLGAGALLLAAAAGMFAGPAITSAVGRSQTGAIACGTDERAIVRQDGNRAFVDCISASVTVTRPPAAVRSQTVTAQRIWTTPSQSPARRRTPSWQKRAVVIGVSAGTGAGIGALAGGKKGALIGAAVGGGGAAMVDLMRHQ